MSEVLGINRRTIERWCAGEGEPGELAGDLDEVTIVSASSSAGAPP
jgi:hypothetical protein